MPSKLQEQTMPNLFSIGEVSEITGVNTVTLRAWQRRYGLINPKRTEKGHRLYSDSDIVLIKEILEWLDKGVSIGKVKGLLGTAVVPEKIESSHQLDGTNEVIQYLEQFNQAKLDRQLNEVMKLYPLESLQTGLFDVVESFLNNEKNPIAELQKALWDSVLTERCIFSVAALRKRNTQCCLLISYDEVINRHFWLVNLQLANKGFNAISLPAINGKLSVLRTVVGQQKIKHVALYGESRISAVNLDLLVGFLSDLDVSVSVHGSIAHIHSLSF